MIEISSNIEWLALLKFNKIKKLSGWRFSNLKLFDGILKPIRLSLALNRVANRLLFQRSILYSALFVLVLYWDWKYPLFCNYSLLVVWSSLVFLVITLKFTEHNKKFLFLYCSLTVLATLALKLFCWFYYHHRIR